MTLVRHCAHSAVVPRPMPSVVVAWTLPGQNNPVSERFPPPPISSPYPSRASLPTAVAALSSWVRPAGYPNFAAAYSLPYLLLATCTQRYAGAAQTTVYVPSETQRERSETQASPNATPPRPHVPRLHHTLTERPGPRSLFSQKHRDRVHGLVVPPTLPTHALTALTTPPLDSHTSLDISTLHVTTLSRRCHNVVTTLSRRCHVTPRDISSMDRQHRHIIDILTTFQPL